MGPAAVRRAAAIALTLAALAAGARAADGPGDRAWSLFYARGVAETCGAMSGLAEVGVARAVAGLRGAGGLDDALLSARRLDGLNAADREWSNRGLGGFRRWCAGEGAAAQGWLEGLATLPALDRPRGLRPPPSDHTTVTIRP